jgi:diaminohydroxyphosphoribosylaminopyrimidine deaminase/5-amino-6-(5-phosphoribosylamino)uracil reductase
MLDFANDEPFMRRALDLAQASIGLASPNPYVGAAIVNGAGEVLGIGTHTYDGLKHAEVLALDQAGTRARGSTLYVNLEPCSHHGRTGPCADAVISAGIRRVVASMRDPNPQVSGKGFARLKEAGVVVDVGAMEVEARRLNEAFAKYIRTRTPLVTLKAAMTLDGKIAPPAGSPREWITGEASRAHVQQLRHQHDAVLVGLGTIIADDPLLTDRSVLPRRRPLLRVVLDSHLRLPTGSQIVKTANEDLLIFCAVADAKRQKELEDSGVRVEQLSASAERRTDLTAVLRRLGELQITSVMFEGGSSVNGAALSAGVVDKVFLYHAPTIMGYSAAVFAAEPAPYSMRESLQVTASRTQRFGDDVAIEGYLKDPYAEEA